MTALVVEGSFPQTPAVFGKPCGLWQTKSTQQKEPQEQSLLPAKRRTLLKELIT
ncbi:hypothetical protein RRSWK_03603 [Rhodopirellula sp. SWK7]|nr:hypothetical protein RRSWK_03603 [Rhodopirellula sp. SWK7]